MKTGRPLPELVRELEAQANRKRDLVAPAQALRVRCNGHAELIVDDAYRLTDTAVQQIADYTGVPKPLVDRLQSASEKMRVPVHGPPYTPEESDCALADVLLTTLLHSKGAERRLIRTLDGAARAFLSDKYLRIDHLDLLEVVLRVLTSGELETALEVASCEITSTRLFLKLVAPQVQAEVCVGDVVMSGLTISNSEVGLGAVSVQPFTVRLVCQNGMTHTDFGVRKTHVGRSLAGDTDAVQFFAPDTLAADSRSYLLKVRDVIRACLTPETFEQIVATYREAASTRLQGDLVKITELTATRLRLSDSERSAVLGHLVESGSLTLWSLANSVTWTAGEATSYDRASELEALGARLLSLPHSERESLVRAA